ncbi:hypothetical protein L1077_26940 [Pseudoalteromonas luteoviolacea]|uniref:hypothetical protein n=1 Tax=Pseudoalteromonas luteoviolacea TaxID=43657 RepID=UPI001F46C456|nr:hypothetical protein [Pseudoalteromonas luteoviolacea]MCF6443067.1 hypothetical protein [Pseudoalteromonas luteoviolacea]
METYEEIKSFLDSHEDIEGILTVDMDLIREPSKSKFECADRYVQKFGFNGLDKRWHILNKEEAAESLSMILHKSLAYSVEMMPLKTAKHIADKFLCQFDPRNSKFLSNGHISEHSASWNPITQSTMEMAVVVIDGKSIGIICAEDED